MAVVVHKNYRKGYDKDLLIIESVDFDRWIKIELF